MDIFSLAMFDFERMKITKLENATIIQLNVITHKWADVTIFCGSQFSLFTFLSRMFFFLLLTLLHKYSSLWSIFLPL